MDLSGHPTVRRMNEGGGPAGGGERNPLDAEWLRRLVLEAGADDVGFVPLERPALEEQRGEILDAFPPAKALISFVVRMNREALRTPARSVANLEFHHAGDAVNEVARRVVRKLEDQGIRALNPAMGFPMEMSEFPGRIWIVSHKPVAIEAGLGRMGIHRNVIHEKFGNFILLGTVVMDTEISRYDRPIDFNPCLECKLCVAVCPVGAIAPDGHFDFSACYTHNYREFMGGFGDWAEQVAASRTALDYRTRVNDTESASMWQSLSFGANYKAAYCLSVCPAGEDVIEAYLSDKRKFVKETVAPLQEKEEVVYILDNSDAEQHVERRFPGKTTRKVGNSLRPRNVDGFLGGLPLVFQRKKSEGLSAVYHFTFTGAERRKVTVVIRDRKVEAEEGHHGVPDLGVTVDSDTWFGFLAGEKNLAWALLRRKIRLHGPPRLLIRFGRCFPK